MENVAYVADAVFMRIALDEARRAAEAGEVPVGAVVVRDGTVIARGCNAPIAVHDPTAHAEIVALRAAAAALGNYRLDGCTLYVTLEPCTMCSGAMLHARLTAVVYGAPDPRTGAAGSVLDVFGDARINHRTAVRGGVLAAECGEVLRAFFQAQRERRQAEASPLRPDALRTPEAVFAGADPLPGRSHWRADLPALDGLRMHWTDTGADPNTVEGRPPHEATAWLCLHGTVLGSDRFADVAKLLAGQGARVAVPDLPGFGRSDKPKREAFHTPECHHALLAQWADAVLPARVVLVVHRGDDALARMLAPALGGRLVGWWRLPSPKPEARDAAAFPDRGHRAGPRAVDRWPAVVEMPSDRLPVLDAQEGADAPPLADQVRHAMEYFRA